MNINEDDLEMEMQKVQYAMSYIADKMLKKHRMQTGYVR